MVDCKGSYSSKQICIGYSRWRVHKVLSGMRLLYVKYIKKIMCSNALINVAPRYSTVYVRFSHARKSLLKALTVCQVGVGKYQPDFIKGKSTRDQTFLLRVAREKAREHKIRDEIR